MTFDISMHFRKGYIKRLFIWEIALPKVFVTTLIALLGVDQDNYQYQSMGK